MSDSPLDVLIIGGGITGAGIALDATLRGLKVGLVEKKDFASGTSSRSTKLIHGGLRYLKQFEFKLVHETGTERAVIHKNAPHLVKPENMLLPIVEGGTLGKIGTSIALWVYDKLAGVEKDEQFEMLDLAKTREAEPLLEEEGLKGSALYTEYRTDDARLTLAVLKTALQKGAICVNYAQATDFTYHTNGRISGAIIKDAIHGKEYTIAAKTVVNAAGPWVDTLRQLDKSVDNKRLHLTKGIHVVIPITKLQLAQSVYFDVKDGRMIFAVPRLDKVYIGTTDTHYNGEMHEPEITMEDVTYLLEAANKMFPSANIQAQDIESGWAGLRPLIHEEGKSPSELSRKDEIFESKSGLLSIAGGKLTGFRKMAIRITDKVAEQLAAQEYPAVIPPSNTETQVLVGGEFESAQSISAYIQTLYRQFGKLEPQMLQIVYFVQTYGKEAEIVLQKALDFHTQGTDKEIALIKGEALFTLENEMVVTLADFWVRRTGKLYFNRASIPALLPEVANVFADYLEWTDAEKNTHLAEWETLFAQNMAWKKE